MTGAELNALISQRLPPSWQLIGVLESSLMGARTRGLRGRDREVLFSLDPLAGEAYITLYVSGLEVTSIGRLRPLETLSVVRRDSYEGLELRFAGARFELLSLQTKSGIKLSWDAVSLGTW